MSEVKKEKCYLALVRHGESRWNKKNVFTGWADVSLTIEGIKQAQLLAKELKEIEFDVMFTSRLERARATLLMIAAEQKKTSIFIHEHTKYDTIFNDNDNIPVFSHRDLNERHYGLLQGMNKEYASEKFGREQVYKWRRSYDIKPPKGESLSDVSDRIIPFFKENILDFLKNGKNVLVSAHGNSLRAVIKEIDKISDEDIVNLNIAPGDAVLYSIEGDILRKERGEHSFERPLKWK